MLNEFFYFCKSKVIFDLLKIAWRNHRSDKEFFNFFRSTVVHIIIYIFGNFTLLYTDNDVTIFINTIMNGNYIFFNLKCHIININSIVLA